MWKKVININNWIRFVTFICFIGMMFTILFHTEWFQRMISGENVTLLKENILITLLLTLLIMLIQNTFTIIPLILVISINYSLFGFFNGFIWSWISSIIGGVLMFIGSRYFFQPLVMKRVNKELLSKVEKNGFLFVFQARIMPFIPTSLINILGGISSIRLKSFLLGTMLGNFIYFFLLTLIPAGLMNPKLNQLVVIGICIILIIYFIYKYKWKRKKAKRSTSTI